ncbi:PREDICTED: leucine-rich repeat and calponin homology domain-containing protein 3 isoform X7 [Capra hircus]|uniref:leucine-rich repeat and calponin homology domain-containing protein 3 isoform X7 n=1 Tax=Capra hircus TaxID=9925 RepID=UPI000847BED1|nr:PREDICTED: leucine-rich repeat and calponin homology domain-containing protein 3 isoform X7 [Capra hircus]
MAAAGLVAVAAAAEYSCPGTSGGNLSAVNCGPNSGAGPGPGPGSWSRSLDRALEEAAVTGVLSLSGRKLREFPRGAANHDLTDTTRADLSRNRLSEIPIEACHFVSLENLNLYQNCIRYVPEAILNLQALTFLNISRNQLSTLPVHLCELPLKVLIASNNKLVSLPEEIGHLRHLMELDVSCNEIQTIPSQIGNLEALRDLNVRRNHLVRLPEELAELPLIRLDFSCNKITAIPVCYRNLRHLQMITLDNNPLQSPPAQICIKGKIHIFKYLNMQACKIAPDLPDYDRRPMGFGSCHEELYSGRPYGALDSGFNSVDSGDKRWSGNEPTDEFSDLPLRVAEITKEQRLRRESQYQENHSSLVVTNGGVEHDLDQIDYIDSCAAEEDEEEVRPHKGLDSDSLSSQFMAYIEQRRISHEGSPVKPIPMREFQKTEDMRRYSHQNRVPAEPSSLLSQSPSHNQFSQMDLELHRRREQLVERTRREAQLAALQYEEEKIRTKQIQRDAVLDFVKQKASQSPQKQHTPLVGECPFPSRRSQHTDDSALLVSLSGVNQVGSAATLPHASAFRPLQNDDRSNAVSNSPTTETAHHSSAYSFPAAIQKNQPQRPESFLFRGAVRTETNKGHASPLLSSSVPTTDFKDPVTRQNSRQREEELELIDQLRKPKLTMAKCRRNVENFLEACRKIGVPQDNLCSPSDILQLNLSVKRTVETLLSLGAHSEESSFVSLSIQLLGFVAFYCTLMLTLCMLYYWIFPL